MYRVAMNFLGCEMIMAAISLGSANSVGIVSSFGSLSWPMTIAVSKSIWNRRSHNDIDASVDARQHSPRPPGFSSGPKRWIFF